MIECLSQYSNDDNVDIYKRKVLVEKERRLKEMGISQ
jgi:hypothetical protein